MVSPPSIEKVVPPLPCPVHELLLKPAPTKKEIQLNIDIAAMFGKMNMTVCVTEMCKIPSVRREFLKLLNIPIEKEYPPIILNTMYIDGQKNSNLSFYHSLGMNDLHLNNMLDFRT
jgi:hypothetical protein